MYLLKDKEKVQTSKEWMIPVRILLAEWELARERCRSVEHEKRKGHHLEYGR